MKDLLDKLSSYNIFNNLFPGVVFVVFAQALTSHSFVQSNIVLGVFLYYFIGLVISRVGSLVVEPVLRGIRFVRFADYKDFVIASQADPKLETLSETNNMYRTLSALFLVLILLKLHDKTALVFPCAAAWGGRVLVCGLLIMFVCAYRKQTQYITKRVGTTKPKGE